MFVHEHPHVIMLPNHGEFHVVGFGDLHFGASDCAEHRFERDVLKKYADQDNVYFVGNGDIFDAIVTSDIKRYRRSAIRDGIGNDDAIVDDTIDMFASLWEKYKIPPRRMLGFISGNHHDTILSKCNTDMTRRLCERLGVEYLGYSAFVKILTRRHTAKIPVVIMTHHGFGGGTRTDGGSITKYCRHAMRFPGAQAYLYGHDHQKWTRRIAMCVPDWNHMEIAEKSIVVCGTGSFKRSVTNGRIPSYSEKAGYPPSEMGSVVLTCRRYIYNESKRHHEGIQITASE